MGADLILFIGKGPKRFKKRDITKAIKRAEKIINYAARIVELGEKEKLRTDAESDELENALKHELLRGFQSQEQYPSIWECLHKLEQMAASTAKDEVNKFADWWMDESGRDTQGRPDPDDKTQKIVCAGFVSWGGDEGAGYGYSIQNEAYWYDIPQNLGVR